MLRFYDYYFPFFLIGDGQQPEYNSLPLLSFDPGGVSEAPTCRRLHRYIIITELNLKPQLSVGCELIVYSVGASNITS